MRNIVKILDNVCGVNNFDIVEEIRLTRGNQYELYFQLATEKSDAQGEITQLRYIPQGTNIAVEVYFDNLDLTYNVKRVATAAFAGDSSIYKVSILAQDQLMFNSMSVVVVEDGVVTNFFVETDIATLDIGDRRKFT